MLNDDAFARMVAEEVKNKLSPTQKAVLKEQENWDRWKNALLYLVSNLEEQVEGIKEDAESDAQRYAVLGRDGEKLAKEAAKAYQYKIIKIDRFKFHVNRRLDDVMSMIETGSMVDSDGWSEVDFLKRAIAKHRSLLREYDLEETSIDKALWGALENKWEFDNVDISNIQDVVMQKVNVDKVIQLLSEQIATLSQENAVLKVLLSQFQDEVNSLHEAQVKEKGSGIPLAQTAR